MSESILRRTIVRGGLAAGLAVAINLWRDSPLALGLLTGGAWNLVNGWCLARALRTWLVVEPSRTRSIAWFLLKFPVLYAAAVGILMAPRISPVGFGLGFLLTLASVLIAAALGFPRTLRVVAPHGR